MHITRTDQAPYCPECGSGKVSLKSIRLSDSGTRPIQDSFWFKCAACLFSTAGRLSQAEAEADMRWQAIGRAGQEG